MMSGKKKSKGQKLSPEKINRLLELLDELYPAQKCFLEYETPWQLLFATILSAQCTDARVNIITKELYKSYPTLEDFIRVPLKELEEAVKPAGFYHNKALHIKECAEVLVEKYNGEMPSSIDELTALPGVGRKTANVIRSHIFNEPSIVVDTHVKRISRLLGLTDTTDPVKAEFELMEVLPREHWIQLNLQLINHGRKICISGRPKCAECRLAEICPSNIEKRYCPRNGAL